jgi:hypothetical protein
MRECFWNPAKIRDRVGARAAKNFRQRRPADVILLNSKQAQRLPLRRGNRRAATGLKTTRNDRRRVSTECPGE